MKDRGSVLPALALLMMGGLIMIGVGIDLGRWGAAYREVAYVADAGADAGAAMIDEQDARVGVLALDPSAAELAAVELALAIRSRDGRVVAATSTRDEICVEVQQVFQPGIMRAVGATESLVTVRSCARPAKG